MSNRLWRLAAVLLVVPALALVQTFALPRVHAANSSPTIILNELNWAGSYESDGLGGVTNLSGDEWIELFNNTNAPIDLTTSPLTMVGAGTYSKTTNPQAILTVNGVASAKATYANTVMPAHGYYLIAALPIGSNSALAITPDAVLTDLSLTNACKPIILQDASATTLDTMGCATGSKYFGDQNTSTSVRRSLARTETVAADGSLMVSDGTLASGWIAAPVVTTNLVTAALGYDYATPGAFNNALAPAPVANVVATPSSHGQTVQLTWDPSADAVSYQVSYLPATGGSATVFSTTTTSATITNLTDKTTYDFSVQAIDQYGQRSTTVTVEATPASTAPITPPTLTSATSDCDAQTCRFVVAWQANDNWASTYRVLYVVNGQQNWSPLLTTTSATLSLLPGQYTFSVFAYDVDGNPSASSNTLSISLNPSTHATAMYAAGVWQQSSVSTLPKPQPKPAIVPVAAAAPTFIPAISEQTQPVTNSSTVPLVQPVAPATPSATSDSWFSNWKQVWPTVLILLAIAAAFFALSRTLDEDEPAVAPTTTKTKLAPAPKLAAKKTTAKKTLAKRKPGRPRGSYKKRNQT